MKPQKETELELIKKIKDSFPDMLDFNNNLKELRSFWKKDVVIIKLKQRFIKKLFLNK